MADAHVSYADVATVIFSHPTIGTCGLTEAQAVEKYGQDNLKVSWLVMDVSAVRLPALCSCMTLNHSI